MKLQGLVYAGAALAAVGGVMSIPAVNAQSAPNGEAIFRQRCASCHRVTEGAPSATGPNLKGVVGRRAASAAPFRYTPALRDSGLTWTPANLDRFLAAPTKTVKGTRMFVALPDAAQRRAVIEYLGRTR